MIILALLSLTLIVAIFIHFYFVDKNNTAKSDLSSPLIVDNVRKESVDAPRTPPETIKIGRFSLHHLHILFLCR